MRLLFVLALLLGSANGMWAQFTLSGFILSEKGEKLAGAHIHTGSQYLHSDSNGHFSILLTGGNHKIHISHIGFQSLDKTVTIKGDLNQDFVLMLDVTTLSEVQLKQAALGNKVQAQEQLRSAQIEKYSQSTLADALKEISGVSTLKTGNALVKPVINGLHSSRVVLLNNQVRLEDQQWGLEHAPNLDVNAADRITVIKGASGLQYGGDAIAGVILVDPIRPLVKDTIYGKVLLNAASNGRGGGINASVTQGFKSGLYYKAQGSFKRFGDYEAPDYQLSNTANGQKAFSASVGYQGHHRGWDAYYSYFQSEIGILRSAHTGNLTDLYEAILGGRPKYIDDFTYDIASPKQQMQHHLAKLKYYQDWHWGKLDLQYAFQYNQRQEFDVRRGNQSNKAALDMDLFTHNLQLDFQSKLSESVLLKSGASTSYQSNTTHLNTGVRPLIPDFEKFDAGIYVVSEYNANEKLKLETGLRYDFSHISATKFYMKSRWEQLGYDTDFSDFIIEEYQNQYKTKPEFTYHNLAASIGARYQFFDNWTSFLNLSTSRRNPNPSELFSDGLHHATGQIELGDLRLKQERSYKVSWNLLYQDAKFSFDFNPYLNRIQDFLFQVPNGLEYTNRGAFPVWNYRQSEALLAGIDATLKYDLHKNWNWQSNFSWVNAQNLDEDKPLPDMPPINWKNQIGYNKKEWSNLYLNLTHEFVDFQNRYPNYDFSAQIVENGELVEKLIPISRPPKSYQLWHFSASADVPVFKKIKTTAVVGVQNIFDTNYRDYLNRLRYYAQEQGRNITVQLKFIF